MNSQSVAPIEALFITRRSPSPYLKGYDSSFKTPEEKAATDAIFRSISEIMIGEPVITDNKAVIPTSAKITANGQTRTFKGQAHLIRDDGVWKLDLTISEDSEQATAQRVGELFGKPVPPA